MNDTGTSIEQTKQVQPEVYASENLPVRKGSRPATVRGPLHIQCSGHGDRQYLHQLVTEVLSWSHIESMPPSGSRPDTIPIRLDEAAAANDSTAFITPREFARVLLGAPTIYLALPLVCAHWAIVRGWAEPHYLSSLGLMPAGTVVVYTPNNRKELSVCYSLFFAAYHFACKLSSGSQTIA